MGVVTFTGTRLCSLQLTMVELLVESTLQRKIVRSIGQAGGGCISNGSSYELDDGKKIFVKYNEDYKVVYQVTIFVQMFIGQGHV